MRDITRIRTRQLPSSMANDRPVDNRPVDSTGSSSNPRHVFADPVAYLATFGIAAEIVVDTTLPAAA